MNSINSFFTDNYDEDVNPKPIFKQYIDKVMNCIDNGSFFREPMVYIYRAIGVLYFLSFFALLLYMSYICKNLAFLDDLLSIKINLVVVLIIAFVACVFALLFWINRSNKLRHRIPNGGDMIIMPIVADFIQSSNEILGLTIMIFGSILSIYFGFIGQLFLKYLEGYFYIAIFCLLSVIGFNIIGYVIITIGHFLGENIRAIATITNNVKDLGDIYRATLLKQDQDSDEPKEIEENSEEEE